MFTNLRARGANEPSGCSRSSCFGHSSNCTSEAALSFAEPLRSGAAEDLPSALVSLGRQATLLEEELRNVLEAIEEESERQDSHFFFATTVGALSAERSIVVVEALRTVPGSYGQSFRLCVVARLCKRELHPEQIRSSK